LTDRDLIHFSLEATGQMFVSFPNRSPNHSDIEDDTILRLEK